MNFPFSLRFEFPHSRVASPSSGRRGALCLGAIALSGLPAAAQAAPDQGLERLDPFTVEAAALTTDIDSLRSSTNDTAQLLQDFAGVDLCGAGGVSSLPSIHGLSDDRLSTQVDGMKLMPACPNHMNPALSYIDPSRVDAVRVYSDIVPVSVGGDSIGGAIQVDSPAPAFAAQGQGFLFGSSAGISYRSNGNAYSGSVGAEAATEALSLTYAGSEARSGDLSAAGRFHATGPAATGANPIDGNQIGSTRFKSENQAVGLAYRSGQNLVQLKADLQNIPFEDFANQRMDMTGNRNTNLEFQVEGRFDWGTLEATAYDQRTQHQMQFGPDKQYWYGAVPGMPMDADGTTSGAEIKADAILSSSDILRVGAELQDYLLNDFWPPSGGGMGPGTFVNVNDGRRDRSDLFAEWESHWAPAWMSILGVRWDGVESDAGDVSGYSSSGMMGMQEAMDSMAFNSANHRLHDDNWNASALLRFTPDGSQVYEGGFSVQSRSPNLYERYAWSTSSMMMVMNNFVGDGNGYVGNLALKPETAGTLSATANWSDPSSQRWSIKVTPFFTRIDDDIDAERLPGSTAANLTSTNSFVLLEYTNDTAQTYGLDVSGRWLLARETSVGSLSAVGGLGYLRGRDLTTGGNLYDVMPLNAKVALEQKAAHWTTTLEAQMVGAKDDVSAVRNEIRTPGYALLNVRISTRVGRFRIEAGIENLADRFYDPPLGGAYVGQGMTMSLNGVPWGVAVPGPARTLYLATLLKY